jgi:hypothetical protein
VSGARHEGSGGGETAGPWSWRDVRARPFPDPESLIPRQPVPEANLIQWWRTPPNGLMTGCLFLDGSALRPQWRATRRAGWDVVQVNLFGSPTAAAFGPVPFDLAPAQTSKDGEDLAVFMATVLTYGACDAYIDCASTVGGCADPLGPTKASSPRAHLWGRIHAAMDFEQFKVHKTKGHATAADLDWGLSTLWEQRGNNGADKYAKLGARSTPSAPTTRTSSMVSGTLSASRACGLDGCTERSRRPCTTRRPRSLPLSRTRSSR